ncbi:TQO small subunit DoxD [Solitalea canadensis]|uniref:Putative membrane protein n=1 Tax=Solitalea canadensis (strain ATCC 29591 / DSM 3403 / JCM 21819 / LMG 8368 / NBRC 15130 / NCIMB 12057 / USAM 9D) TaxID=929556 RepID=H8KP59_SOLCM|nr:TQO small subunit DoxD [Solitalea canadensis]AFD05696.1 putative membrane protein [Solitalea canadensis DSM 3403]
MVNHFHNNKISASQYGSITLALRVVTGWTYFSAFWRRLILENKLDPDAPGYIGEKFNHFLPNALLIKPQIEFLVTHPDWLWWAMLVFTIIEGVVGLLFMLGLFTRLMSIGVFSLAMGILLGAGWLGTTCLDEWQIGVLGVAAGFTVFLSGGGAYSVDTVLQQKIGSSKLMNWLSSGEFSFSEKILKKIVIGGTVFITALTLFTNQYFHGGVWGKLHNLSVKPNIHISGAQIENGKLSFTIFRNEGADVYGSFLIKITLKDKQGNILMERAANELASMSKSDIKNYYVAKVKPGKLSIVVPLGAKATLHFIEPVFLQSLNTDDLILELTDISGIIWTSKIN